MYFLYDYRVLILLFFFFNKSFGPKFVNLRKIGPFAGLSSYI